MARCAYCNSRIFFGGVKDGDQRFCNRDCYQKGVLLPASHRIPDEVVLAQINQVHQGRCPKCSSRGPVDVHPYYKVMSFLILTRWGSGLNICCRGCGLKSQLGYTGLSLVLGWWGFPWGLIMTPIQVVRNISAMINAPDPSRPSAQLEKLVRLHLAKSVLAQAPPPASVPPPAAA